ncbi:MAG: hypothetical protein J0G32_07330 [Alphaproteobacteria bacterium]|nr:hypothetical protein [Alphaproteobacteria bacterium]OJV14177.1 MAG: hypothetical protein BGO27_01605 [Alphaproteobacteria bacterium 33-17]
MKKGYKNPLIRKLSKESLDFADAYDKKHDINDALTETSKVKAQNWATGYLAEGGKTNFKKDSLPSKK